jgi:hypothetical protein
MSCVSDRAIRVSHQLMRHRRKRFNQRMEHGWVVGLLTPNIRAVAADEELHCRVGDGFPSPRVFMRTTLTTLISLVHSNRLNGREYARYLKASS